MIFNGFEFSGRGRVLGQDFSWFKIWFGESLGMIFVGYKWSAVGYFGDSGGMIFDGRRSFGVAV